MDVGGCRRPSSSFRTRRREGRGGGHLIELAFEHRAEEELVDARLETIHHLRVLIEQVHPATDAKGLEEGAVGGVVSLEQALVVL